MKLYKFSKQYQSAIEDAVRASFIPRDFGTRLEEFLWNVDNINRLNRFAKKYGDERLSEIEIHDVFTNIIGPASVSISGAEEDHDFLLRDDLEQNNFRIWSVVDFHQFYLTMKKISNNETSKMVSDLRLPITLSGTNKQFFSIVDNNGVSICPSLLKVGIVPWELETALLDSESYTETVERQMNISISHVLH